MTTPALSVIEDEVAALYQELLDLPPAFDRTASFIKLGGQSAAAAQMQIRLMQLFGVVISFGEMYKASDVTSLSALIHAHLEEQQ